ncbi:MAG: carboxypeptidase [Bacteroidota bacterium]
MHRLTTLLFLLVWGMGYLMGQEEAHMTPSSAKTFTSTQTVKIEGRSYELDTEAGTLVLRDENDHPIADFGFTYYKGKISGDQPRPIMFAFNGGPLSASFWLHMGILGPKRIAINDPDLTPGPPYQIVNNEYALLDIADLVMIDPVGVGLSHPIGKAKWEDFWGVDQDVRAIGLFIKQFLIKEGRLNAPKFLLGESYGTFRNGYLMDHLQSKGISMNGVIMVSAVFDLQHLLFPYGDDLSYLVHFPTYAATHWYHQDDTGGRKKPLESYLKEVRDFTINEYAPAMIKGDALSMEDKKELARKLSVHSGLEEDFWLQANFRVTAGEFFQEYMRDEGKIVGRLDSRFTGNTLDLLSQTADHDPQSAAISPPYISAFLDYFYNDLGVDKKLSYTTSAGGRKGFKWDWRHQGNISWNAQATISTAPDMARCLNRNPNMKVLILNGYYDIATPFFGVEYTLDHMDLRPEIKENVIMKYYEAGHMMYTHKASMEKFRKDVSEFMLDMLK